MNPVTALEFFCTQYGALLLLAGEGSYLKVFNAETSRLLCQCEVFHDQVIHGIVVREALSQENDLQVVVWGGATVALLQGKDLQQLLHQGELYTLDKTISTSDWILNAAISPYHDNNCVLSTAHNTVLLATLDKHTNSTCLKTLHSPSRSILYSTDLIWESSVHVLVAAGTVFGEIIVWQCSTAGEAPSKGSRVLFTFTGHEGSVFGVNISPPITETDGNSIRLLASCSDDRTIRIWNISTDSKVQARISDQVSHESTLLRETGFGDNGENVRATTTYNRCLATAMGHASRIWRVKFILQKSITLKRPVISVLSFGEDSTTQLWHLDLKEDSQTSRFANGRNTEMSPGVSTKLTRMKTFAFHCGKHIWSAATSRIRDVRNILATGGADGKISLYDIPESFSEERMALSTAKHFGHDTDERLRPLLRTRSWALDDILSGCQTNSYSRGDIPLIMDDSATYPIIQPSNGQSPKQKKIKKPLKDGFNRYAFVSEGKILVTTTFGRVFIGCIDIQVKWYEVILPDSGRQDLKSYVIVEGIPEIGLAFLAGANGKIYVYHTGSKLLEVGLVGGKIADMFKVFDPEVDFYALLVTTLASKVATLFHLHLPLRDSPSFSKSIAYHIPDRFVVTSAGRSGNLFLLGSRTGSLAVYSHQLDRGPLSVWEPDSSDGRDAITAIVALPGGSHGSSIHFMTTCRNGTYSVFASTVTRDTNMMILEARVYPVHHGVPPFGPVIEAGWFEGQDLFLCGFRSKHFIVWNESQQCELMNVDCGGAHRSYAYLVRQTANNSSHFIYTKASTLHLESHPESSHKIIKQGGHGREIKSCADSPDSGLVATGAEDTVIRIWRYQCYTPIQDRLECLAIIQKHTAGIQHLQWYKSEYLFSSGGNEEFFVWAIQPIPGFGIGVVCEASCPDQSEERDLRIMSFSVTEMSNLLALNLEPKLLICLVYSDSTIRSYTYSKPGGFILAASGRYTSSCLMQIAHLQMLGSESEIYLLTAATDGNLTLWKSTISVSSMTGESDRSCVSSLVVISDQKVHQSAIKSLDLAIIGLEKDIVVATGGDDNTLAVSIYRIQKSSKEDIGPESIIFGSAHSASITGLCILPRGGEDDCSFSIVSSSNDQRVKVWGVRLSGESQRREDETRRRGDKCHVEIEKIADVFTPVADVGDLAVLDPPSNGEGCSKVLVVGNGMEVWNVPWRARH